MRGRGVALVLLLAGCCGIVGCMSLWRADNVEKGLIEIALPGAERAAPSVTPKLIPAEATKVRIRVWHPDTGFNVLNTVARNGEPQTIDIAVPENEGYRVAAVSYRVRDERALALTGGETPNVAVTAREITPVQLTLQPWDAEVETEDPVEPGESYIVEFVASDAGGLITRETFHTSKLYASVTAFQDPEAALPTDPVTGVVLDGQMSFAATAPDVEDETTVYHLARVAFTSAWDDATLEDIDERSLYLELPNRQLGEPLHEVTVDPLAGGIIIEITRQD